MLYFLFTFNSATSKRWTESPLSFVRFVISERLSLGWFDRECSLCWNFPNIRKECLWSRLLPFSRGKSLLSSRKEGAWLLVFSSLVAGRMGVQAGLRWGTEGPPFQVQSLINSSAFRELSQFYPGCLESQHPESLPTCVDWGFLHSVWAPSQFWSSADRFSSPYDRDTVITTLSWKERLLWGSTWSTIFNLEGFLLQLTAKIEKMCSNSTLGTIWTSWGTNLLLCFLKLVIRE